MEKKYDKIRTEYRLKPFGKNDVDLDPFKQFSEWIDMPINSGIKEPTAMVLSTVGKNLQPSTRMVLLKEIKNDGFIFYTNYDSKKGRQISENHYGSLLFYWPELEKQVRIEGRIEKTSQEILEEYYLTRSAKRRIGHGHHHKVRKYLTGNIWRTSKPNLKKNLPGVLSNDLIIGADIF